MTGHINVQIINGRNGKPEFVVIPYRDYLKMNIDDEILIPHEVVSATVDGFTPMRAWRDYLGLTQEEVAKQLHISQPAYAQMENQEKPRRTSLKKVAGIFEITFEQLSIY